MAKWRRHFRRRHFREDKISTRHFRRSHFRGDIFVITRQPGLRTSQPVIRASQPSPRANQPASQRALREDGWMDVNLLGPLPRYSPIKIAKQYEAGQVEHIMPHGDWLSTALMHESPQMKGQPVAKRHHMVSGSHAPLYIVFGLKLGWAGQRPQ